MASRRDVPLTRQSAVRHCTCSAPRGEFHRQPQQRSSIELTFASSQVWGPLLVLILHWPWTNPGPRTHPRGSLQTFGPGWTTRSAARARPQKDVHRRPCHRHPYFKQTIRRPPQCCTAAPLNGTPRDAISDAPPEDNHPESEGGPARPNPARRSDQRPPAARGSLTAPALSATP
jgi:hypothetical protein